MRIRILTQSILTMAVVAVIVGVVDIPSAYANTVFYCAPKVVRERSNRIEVRCHNSVRVGSDTVEAITYAKTDVPRMERFIRIAVAAMLSKKKLRVELPTSTSGNLNGCYGPCRTITYPFGLEE